MASSRKRFATGERGQSAFFKVKGHAEEELVRRGQVREFDSDGNYRADDAADFGRRRVGPHVIDARRDLQGVVGGGTQSFRCCTGSSLQSRVQLSMMMVLLVLGLPVVFPRDVGLCVRCVMLLYCLDRRLSGMLVGLVSFPHLLLLMTSAIGRIRLGFWSNWLPSWLHWPVSGADLGVGGVSYVELLILFELWAGERLCVGEGSSSLSSARRPISVSAVPLGPGIDILALL